MDKSKFLLAFRQHLQAKVTECGNLRTAAPHAGVEFTKLSRIIGGKRQMTVPEFLLLLEWIGGSARLP